MVFLSIVIPTYNRAHLIEDTLKSVINQTNKNYEIIIVDDGSTDNTEEVVRKYLSDSVNYYKIENSERAAARNYGTKKANGRYINWFDSDDEMLPHHVQTIVNIAEENNFPEVITLNYDIKNSITKKIKPNRTDFKWFSLKKDDFLIKGNFLGCNSVIVRKDIAIQNLFNEKRALSASEDYELWLKIKAQYNFIHTDEITSYLIQHDERSVNLMSDVSILEKRFLTLIDVCEKNEITKNYLGNNLNYFKMRNFLILAVELSNNGHKKKSLHYLITSIKHHPRAIFQRLFWATIKHLIF
jgi:glycosyltransferase involved in cell wall biosynthesis